MRMKDGITNNYPSTKDENWDCPKETVMYGPPHSWSFYFPSSKVSFILRAELCLKLLTHKRIPFRHRHLKRKVTGGGLTAAKFSLPTRNTGLCTPLRLAMRLV